jgi:hypothetical protein
LFLTREQKKKVKDWIFFREWKLEIEYKYSFVDLVESNENI